MLNCINIYQWNMASWVKCSIASTSINETWPAEWNAPLHQHLSMKHGQLSEMLHSINIYQWNMASWVKCSIASTSINETWPAEWNAPLHQHLQTYTSSVWLTISVTWEDKTSEWKLDCSHDVNTWSPLELKSEPMATVGERLCQMRQSTTRGVTGSWPITMAVSRGRLGCMMTLNLSWLQKLKENRVPYRRALWDQLHPPRVSMR